MDRTYYLVVVLKEGETWGKYVGPGCAPLLGDAYDDGWELSAFTSSVKAMNVAALATRVYETRNIKITSVGCVVPEECRFKHWLGYEESSESQREHAC